MGIVCCKRNDGAARGKYILEFKQESVRLISRQVVGWSMREHMQASVVADALRMTWFRRRRAGLYGRRFATRRDAMDEVIDWLTFYNYKRLRSTLGYVSPMTFEQRWSAARQQPRKSA